MKIISNKNYKAMVESFKEYENRIDILENENFNNRVRIKELTKYNSVLKEDLQKSQSSVGGYVKHNNELKRDNELLITENNKLKKDIKQSKEELVSQSKNYVSQINQLREENTRIIEEYTKKIESLESDILTYKVSIKEQDKQLKELTKCNDNYKKELEKQHIQQTPKEYLTRQPKRRKKVKEVA